MKLAVFLTTTILCFSLLAVGTVALEKQRRVLFVNYAAAGTEVNQQTIIGEELTSRGHAAEFLVVENYRKTVEKHGLPLVATFPSFEQDKLNAVARKAVKDASLDTYIKEFFPEVISAFTEKYEPAVNILNEYVEEKGRPDMIVTGMFCEGVIDYAATHDIPLAIIYATPLGSIAGLEDHVAAPDNNFWHAGEDMASFGGRFAKVWRTVKLILQLLPSAGQTAALREKYQLKPTAGPLDNWKGAAIFHTWSFGIEPARSTNPLTFTIGLLNKEYDPTTEVLSDQDQELKDHLDTLNGGAVFVGFGSFGILPQDMFDNIVAGLNSWVQVHQKDGQHAQAIFALNPKVYSAEYALDLSKVPKTVKIVGWAHQKMVLHHPNTKAFVTHAGQASIAEALDAQVPMLGIPLFGDQPTNSYYVTKAGIGQYIHFREEPLTSTAVAEKLLNLTDHNAVYFRDNLARQKLINSRHGGAKKAADVIEDFFILGNLNHLIPVTDSVPYPASINLDVWMVFFLVLGTTVFAIYKLLSWGFSCIIKKAKCD
mmetsp:Transcript_10899/g.19548  ORF Transcript_10899/g.19548 Transcript_10899/m.19548 type:complete len:539 (-) Transcript_10899:187-1803(-)